MQTSQSTKIARGMAYTAEEEAILIELKSTYPTTKWVEINKYFNERVPFTRQRTVDGLCGKWKELKRKIESGTGNERAHMKQSSNLEQSRNEIYPSMGQVCVDYSYYSSLNINCGSSPSVKQPAEVQYNVSSSWRFEKRLSRGGIVGSIQKTIP